jgi:hypothetical protein
MKPALLLNALPFSDVALLPVRPL